MPVLDLHDGHAMDYDVKLMYQWEIQQLGHKEQYPKLRMISC